MLIKFERAASGDRRGHKLAKYLEAENDHADRKRANVQVLRGNPQLTGQVIDGLQFKNRHLHGLIAWAPDDNPTPEQIDQVLDTYESVAFAGLDPARYSWAAVRHDDPKPKGGVHVHTIIARTDLNTGIFLPIMQPNWQMDFDPVEHLYNAFYGWADPADPAHKRKVQPGHEARKSGIKVASMDRASITNYIGQLVDADLVQTREDVITFLQQDVGEVTRAGMDYISVKPVGHARAIRLRGAFYERDFTQPARPGAASPGEAEQPVSAVRTIDRSAVKRYRGAVNEAIERRRKFHVRRLEQADRNKSNHSVQALASAADSWLVHDTGPSVGQRGGHQSIDIDDCRTSPDIAANGTGSPRPGYVGDRRAAVPGGLIPDYESWRSAPGRVPERKPPRPLDYTTRGLNNDRVRKQIVGRSQAYTGGAEGNRPTVRIFDAAVAGFTAAVAGFTAVLSRFRALVVAIIEQKISQHRDLINRKEKERSAAQVHTPPLPRR